MNLPVIFSKALTAVKGVGGKALLIGKKRSPEICIALSILGFGGTIIATVHATNETRDILDEKEESEKLCEQRRSIGFGKDVIPYTEQDYIIDIKKLKRRTRRKLLKAWWPVGTLGAGSVISLLSGYKILNGRYVATAAAYKTLEAGHERYREQVIARFGKEVDRELLDIKAEEIERELKKQEDEQRAEDASGKKKKKKALVQGSDLVIFDENSERWRRYWTPDMVLDYLKIKENECNDIRVINGHIFENEVRDRLGLKRTSDGAVRGWIDKPVDFGLSDSSEATVNKVRNILSVARNCDIHVPIRLDTEGLIFDRI